MNTFIDLTDASSHWYSHGLLSPTEGFIFGATNTIAGHPMSHDVGFVTLMEWARASDFLDVKQASLDTT